MKHRTMMVTPLALLLAALAPGELIPSALAQDFLPPEALVESLLMKTPEVRAAEARLAAAGAQGRALAAGSHEFEVSLIPQQRSTRLDGDFDEWEVQFGRSIRLPGKAALDRDIASHGIRAATLHHGDAQHQAARQLLGRWMDWLRASHTLTETRAQLDSLETERAALARRVELGDAAQLDLDLLDAERAQAQVLATRSEADATATRQALSSDFPQLPLPEKLPALPEPQALPGTLDTWVERIRERSHEIGAARAEADRQASMAARARAERKPDPSLGLRMISERDGDEKLLGVVLSVPIGIRHRRALAEAAAAEADSLQQDAQAVARDIERDARLVVARAANLLEQWRAQQAADRAIASVAGRIHRAWELGEAGLAERLLAERRRRESALQETVLRSEALQAGLEVLVDSHELWHAEP